MVGIEKLFFGAVLLLVLQIMQFIYPPAQKTSVPPPVTEVKGEYVFSVPIIKIIDGDTIQVTINGNKETVRIIGINTPETVDSRREVECFGIEASNFAKEILSNQIVRLENDPTQADRDKYGRLLRYVWLKDGTDFGLKMIMDGFAYEYTYDKPYKYQLKYKDAQSIAENNKAGLWKDNICPKN